MEFQAVILAAGKGSRMSDLVRDKTPKCLLPIANMPMILYPLRKLESHGFSEVIIIVLDCHKHAVSKKLAEENLKIKYELFEVANEDLGTAESLRKIRSKVFHDLIVLSCDTITNVPLQKLVDAFRVEDASLTCLLSHQSKSFMEATTPGPKRKQKRGNAERDFVGLEPDTNRLLFLANEADVEDDVITFKKSLFRRHPRAIVKSNILDGHIYIMKRWVLDYMDFKSNKETLKGEFIPYLLSKQFKTRKACKTNEVERTDEKNIDDFISTDKWSEALEQFSLSSPSSLLPLSDRSNIVCNAVLTPSKFSVADEEQICVRVNTVAAFFEANKSVTRFLPDLFITRVDEGAEERTLSADSTIGVGVRKGKNVIIRRSVIGKNCRIEDGAKIINSVLMDSVVVETQASVAGSILLEDAVVGDGVEIKDSVIGYAVAIEKGTRIVNETLVKNMMEI